MEPRYKKEESSLMQFAAEDKTQECADSCIQKDCPICMSIMVQPVQLVCGHRFCACCTNTMQAKKDQDNQCPLCRGPFDYKLFKPTQKMIKDHKLTSKHCTMLDEEHRKLLEKNFADEYKEYEKVMSAKSMLKKLFCGSHKSLQLTFGNRYKHLTTGLTYTRDGTANEHWWQMFVELKDPEMRKLIPFLFESVTYSLHPTAAASQKVVKTEAKNHTKPLTIQYAGWGSYGIPITIKFRKEIIEAEAASKTQDPQIVDASKGIKLDHDLCFSDNGQWKTIAVKISETAFEKALELQAQAGGAAPPAQQPASTFTRPTVKK